MAWILHDSGLLLKAVAFFLVACRLVTSEDAESLWFRHRRSTPGSQPLRVHWEMIESTSPTVNEQRKRIESALAGAKQWVEKTLSLRETGANPLRLARACSNNSALIRRQESGGTLIHYYCRSNACAASTACGPLAAVPEAHLDLCQSCRFGIAGCQQCIDCGVDTSQPLSAGVANADLIVYILMDCSHVSGSQRLATGDACLRNGTTDRPNGGWIAVCPARFTDDQAAFQTAEVLRELLRVLGLSQSQMGFWRDGSGQPRSNRDTVSYLPLGISESTLQTFDKNIRTGLVSRGSG